MVRLGLVAPGGGASPTVEQEHRLSGVFVSPQVMSLVWRCGRQEARASTILFLSRSVGLKGPRCTSPTMSGRQLPSGKISRLPLVRLVMDRTSEENCELIPISEAQRIQTPAVRDSHHRGKPEGGESIPANCTGRECNSSFGLFLSMSNKDLTRLLIAAIL